MRLLVSFASFVSFVTIAAPLAPAARAGAAVPFTYQFNAAAPAEILATVTVRCDQCAWDVEGREAVVLTVSVDGRYSQHLPLVRSGRAEYQIMLGGMGAGAHTVVIDQDPALTSRLLRGASTTVETITVEQVRAAAQAQRPLGLAPFVYARPDTVGRFTDVPVFMWYEVEPTSAGERYRYTVVFTNEDGGTPTDRLMATWGRTTDIEYLYSVEVDRAGTILNEDMQGPKHEVLPFRGRREGSHPLLWVSTENNMVLDTGKTTVRYAPAPILVRLQGVSREAVMDAHPWLYEVASKELMREGKIVPDAPVGKSVIPDPRRFVYIEGCGEVGASALSFAVQVGDAWIPSDRGIRDQRITRDGCFRAAIPVPAAAAAGDVRALRAQAHTRAPSGGTPAPQPTSVRLTRINRVFMLDDHYRPQAPLLTWKGAVTLAPDGPPAQIVSR